MRTKKYAIIVIRSYARPTKHAIGNVCSISDLFCVGEVCSSS